jgi:hypothetical protein
MHTQRLCNHAQLSRKITQELRENAKVLCEDEKGLCEHAQGLCKHSRPFGNDAEEPIIHE